jgi:hypothetical protein
MGEPWKKYANQPASSGGIFSVPAEPDPDKALRHQMLQLDLQKKMKDATKEQVGDKEVEALARMYAANKLVPPTRPNEVAQKAIARAMEIDPSYDPELAGNRAKAIKDFSGNGQASQVVRSVNRLAAHLSDMFETSEKMGGPNTGIRPLNKLIASVEQQGQPELVAKFDAAKPFVATELEKIMKGAGQPTVSGIEEAMKGLDRARSLDERRAAFKQIGALVHGALDPIKQSWNSAYGGTKAPPMWVSPKAAEVFGHVDPDNAGTFGGDDWRGLPGLKGDGTEPTLPQGGGGNPPPNAPITPATGSTKTDFIQSDVDKKVAAMLAGGVPAAKIKKFAGDSGANYPHLDAVLAWRALNPKYKGGYDVSTERVVPTTLANRMAASPVAALAAGAGDALTAGFADEGIGAVNTLKNGGSLSDNIAAADLAKQTLANANPGMTLAGNVLGGAGAMIGGGLAARSALEGGAIGRSLLGFAEANPIKAAALGDTAYGTAYGAGENNDNRALGAGIGAVTAPIASFAGSGATKVAGKALTGVVDPAVQRLRDLGIPLTAGEVLGGGWKKAQDALTSVMGPGDMVARRYADGRRALNEAGYNMAGDVIGTPINKVGQPAINALDAAKSQAYSNALDPISLNLNTPDFINPMKGVMAGASEIPAGELPEGYANSAINRFVGNNIAPDGTMAGRDFQKAYRGLAQTANKVAPKVEGFDVGQALGQAKDILASTLEDQNPGAYEGFLKANQANRMLNILAKAHNAAKNQISDGGEVHWTPAQLGTASTANAVKYGSDIAAAGGNRPFNQLINDSQQVMSSKVPDSGTAKRLLAMGLATGTIGGGGGVGYEVGGDTGAELGVGIPLALTLGGTKVGQQLLVNALIKRTVADQATGRMLRKYPQIGGDVLAGLGIPLLDSPAR